MLNPSKKIEINNKFVSKVDAFVKKEIIVEAPSDDKVKELEKKVAELTAKVTDLTEENAKLKKQLEAQGTQKPEEPKTEEAKPEEPKPEEPKAE